MIFATLVVGMLLSMFSSVHFFLSRGSDFTLWTYPSYRGVTNLIMCWVCVIIYYYHHQVLTPNSLVTPPENLSCNTFPGIMTYNGLESCIINSYSYDNESRTSMVDGCPTDSMDEDVSSSSSSKDAFGSFSSQWLMNKSEEYCPTKCEIVKSPNHFSDREKPAYTIQFSDVETMKERFAKLLLGEDISGGCKGHSTALALSNAITNLAGKTISCTYRPELC